MITNEKSLNLPENILIVLISIVGQNVLGLIFQHQKSNSLSLPEQFIREGFLKVL
jgi:hypothetical protein